MSSLGQVQSASIALGGTSTIHIEGEILDDRPYASPELQVDLFLSVVAGVHRCASAHLVSGTGSAANTLQIVEGAAGDPGAAAREPGTHWEVDVDCSWDVVAAGRQLYLIRALAVTRRENGSLDVYDWARWIEVAARRRS